MGPARGARNRALGSHFADPSRALSRDLGVSRYPRAQNRISARPRPAFFHNARNARVIRGEVICPFRPHPPTLFACSRAFLRFKVQRIVENRNRKRVPSVFQVTLFVLNPLFERPINATP